MAGFFGVSRSAYYLWARNVVSQRRKAGDTELIRLIREIVTRDCLRYGRAWVRMELRDAYGKPVSLKEVARLMRENNLNVRRKRKYILTTDWKHGFAVCENILNRGIDAESGGLKWV